MEKLKKGISGKRYSRQIVLEAVKLVESGFPREEIRSRFGLGQSTLNSWMQLHGSQAYHDSKRRTYSKTQKRAVVSAVKHGMSIADAQVAYGVRCGKVIRDWVREYEAEKSDLCVSTELMAKTRKEQEPEDVAALRRELELARLKIEALNTLIDVAEDQLKIDIRKKSGARRSTK